MGYFQPLDRAYHQPSAVSFSRRHSDVKPLNAEPRRNEAVVASAATVAAPGTFSFVFNDLCSVFLSLEDYK